MSFLVWNARGVSNTKIVAHLKLIIKSYHLSFLAIVEPMISFSDAVHIGNKIGLKAFYSNEAEEGKIWSFVRDRW